MVENVNEHEVVNSEEVAPPRTLLETYLHPNRVSCSHLTCQHMSLNME